jgi:opacity protein-like surface antigen
MISRPLGLVLATAFLASIPATAGAESATVETETTTTVTEEAPSKYGYDAPYVSAGGVYAIENNNSAIGTGISDYGNIKNSWGYDLRIGYEFRDMFAAEVQWQSLVNFNTNARDPVTNVESPSIEARMLSLNGRVSPLEGRIQPYALFGLGWFNVQADRTSVSIHESSFAARFGLGVAAFITERAGVSFEAGYILPMTSTLGGKDRFDHIPMTLSLFFKFK